MKKITECPFPRLFPSQLDKNDEFYMQLAYNESITAWENDEVPVGAVIVDTTGDVIASSHNQTRKCKDPTAHAEMLAIQAAMLETGQSRLDEYDLWVTLEPCTMCAGAIAHARIKRLYFAAHDEKAGAVESGVRFFDSPSCHHSPEIYGGIGANKAAALMQNFFAARR